MSGIDFIADTNTLLSFQRITADRGFAKIAELPLSLLTPAVGLAP